ncbi:hypothetical protein RJ640_011807 [Escallonia rubra]|uniref:Uncharacterized protein n=1 Tax=Escallonia rubra TaxID=112253 RepID=A0AA88U9L4_9ASTE|nr:hypothetical protein RJ640_011807 [Escallonia rubra]
MGLLPGTREATAMCHEKERSPIIGTQCVIVETALQAGASQRYELLWIILIGFIIALIIQSLAANISGNTGKHLAEVCEAEYPRYITYCLWFLAEISVIATDIPEGMKYEPLPIPLLLC